MPTADQIATALLSGDGELIAGALISLLVYLAERYTPPTWFATAASKRVLALALVALPVISASLLAKASLHDVILAGLTVLLAATGTHALVVQPMQEKDAPKQNVYNVSQTFANADPVKVVEALDKASANPPKGSP